MDLNTAERILASRGVIGVSYEDREIWIEEIFEDSMTARVKSLETDQEFLAPLSKLHEDKTTENLEL